MNTLTMPMGAHRAGVNYQPSCFELTLTHLGQGSDPAASPFGDGAEFHEHIVDDDLTTPYDARAADLDGDGRLDVLGGGNGGVAWWHLVGREWVEQEIDYAVPRVNALRAEDLDGDGDLDVAAATENAVRVWLNVVGDGSAWSSSIIDFAPDVSAIDTADFDGDGDFDLVAASHFDGRIAWWENAIGDASIWERNVLDSSFAGAESLQVADVDGDGDPDLLGAGEDANDIAWWENRDAGARWTKHLLAGAFDGAKSVAAGDLDGDGDLDIVGAAELEDLVLWWENEDGAGSRWTERTVTKINSPDALSIADVDSDGDLDLLVAASSNDPEDLLWFENRSGDGTVWRRFDVEIDGGTANSVTASDLDQDGDPDVLAAIHPSIALFENRYGATCPPGRFAAGDAVRLRAQPNLGWVIAGWQGTDDDRSARNTNRITMTAADHVVAVLYVEE